MEPPLLDGIRSNHQGGSFPLPSPYTPKRMRAAKTWVIAVDESWPASQALSWTIHRLLAVGDALALAHVRGEDWAWPDLSPLADALDAEYDDTSAFDHDDDDDDDDAEAVEGNADHERILSRSDPVQQRRGRGRGRGRMSLLARVETEAYSLLAEAGFRPGEVRVQCYLSGESHAGKGLLAISQDVMDLIIEVEKEARATTLDPTSSTTPPTMATETEHCQDNPRLVLVAGSRGLSTFAREAGSFFGLGSTSDYLLTHATFPVLVVKHLVNARPSSTRREEEDIGTHPDTDKDNAEQGVKASFTTTATTTTATTTRTEARPSSGPYLYPDLTPGSMRVVAALDGSASSKRALVGVLDLLRTRCRKGAREGDRDQPPQHPLHIVSVVPDPPTPVFDSLESPTLMSTTYDQLAKEEAEILAAGERIVAEGARLVGRQGYPQHRVSTAVLPAHGKNSGATLVAYARDVDAELIVLGRRGLSGRASALYNLVGLGSVELQVAHQFQGAVLVDKCVRVAGIVGDVRSGIGERARVPPSREEMRHERRRNADEDEEREVDAVSMGVGDSTTAAQDDLATALGTHVS